MVKVDNSVRIAGIAVGGVVVVALIVVYAVFNFLPTETIVSDGVATVEVLPDVVSVYFSVETSGADAVEAKDANAEIVDDVVAGLMGIGLDRSEIVTQGFNVYEEFDYSEKGRKSLGFKAVHSLKVDVPIGDSVGGNSNGASEVDVGEVIDVGIDSGAMLGYINFELSQGLENEYKAEALKLAAEDARVKAEAVAEGVGAKLGRVVSTQNSDFGYYPFLAYEAVDGVAVRGDEVETEIVAGEREVSARVSVTYRIRS